MSILPPALFLHSSPHNWVRKCLDFLPFIGELPYIYFTVDKTLCMYVCMYVIYLYFIFIIFLLTEQTAKQRCVTQNQRQDRVRKCQYCLKETCPGNSNISNCPETCIVPCKKCKYYNGCQSMDHGRSCTAGSW
jgi:hypothetical protein